MRGWIVGPMGLLLIAIAGCASNEAAPAAASEHPPAVRSAECRWMSGRIKLDGVLNETAWDKAEVLRDFSVYWQDRKARSATTARLLWDNDYLYYSADMEDADLYATIKEHNGMLFTEDVFELFFKPAEDKLAYYEFEVNPLGAEMELFLPSRGAGGYGRVAALTKIGMESAVHLDGTLNKWDDVDKGWTVEGRIPWTGFKPTGGRPKPGDKWRFALCRYDYSVKFDRPELSSTAPLTQPEFHRYEDYGELTFVRPGK
jgi:Carbohydrate family 9 binding domain-like